MSMSDQITSICKSVRYQLRNIGFIRKYLTRSATEKLVHSLISSRIDFGGYSSLFRRFVIPKDRLIRRFVIPKVRYSERSVIPKVR